ncbi:MAG: nucleotidyltransferase domain-containing protein [Deltaproteobacteria bacterium]|nr:nucleotidyltransferase domain-containing protein [Deltaproteobacteria bacterium]
MSEPPTGPARLAAVIGPIAAGTVWVEVCVLFGSGARDRLGPESDVDVGWLGTAPADGEAALRAALERALHREVHLVDLGRAPDLLRVEVARGGVVAFERTPAVWTTFVGDAIARWLDIAPMIRACAEGVRRHALGGSGSPHG